MIPDQDLRTLAERLLESHPNAVVRHRLLRDVLRLQPDSPELIPARKALLVHRWVSELSAAQLPDGSWGRFHSMDSSRRARFPTSEAAIHRGLTLGLTRDDPPLAGALDYILAVLEGRQVWSDRVEKSEGWPIGFEAINAGMLAEVAAGHPILESPWAYWLEIAESSFPDGQYSSRAEWNAHKQRRGRGILYLRSRYVLSLLGARGSDLPPALAGRLLEWIAHEPQGIGYIGASVQHPNAFHIAHWLDSLEILSRFPGWQDVLRESLSWLWEQRDPDGRWDFGSHISRTWHFPLSDDWRGSNRALDFSTCALALLRKCSG